MTLPAFFRRKAVRVLFALLMTAATAWVMLRLVLASKDQLANITVSFHPIPLVLTFPLFFASTLLTAFIWGQMISCFDNRVPSAQHIVIYLATQFAGRIPGGVWNVVGRIAWYEQLGVRKRITAFVSILQWFLVLWSGTIVLLLALPWLIGLNLKNILLLALPIFLIALLLNPRVVRLLMRKVLKQEEFPNIRYQKILSWLGLYLVIWMMGGTILFLVTAAVYPAANSWLYSLAAWSAAGVSGTLVTFLPSGLGVAEVVSSLVLAVQIPSSISVVVSLVMRVLLTAYEFVISLAFLVVSRIRRSGAIPLD